MKLWEVPALLPVALRFRAPLFVPYRTTPVAVRSVEKVMPTLVLPESALFTLEASDTRLTRIEVDPVFPARSVARAVIVLSPPVRLVTVFNQVAHEIVAAAPFTRTLATPQESVTAPENTIEPLTVAPLACDVIVMIGAIVSPTLVL